DVMFQNELERIADAKPGDVSIDVRKAARTGRGRQIDVCPGNVLRNETAQEPGRQDLITLAVHTALQDIRDLAFQVGVIIRVERKIPHALAARAAGFYQL